MSKTSRDVDTLFNGLKGNLNLPKRTEPKAEVTQPATTEETTKAAETAVAEPEVKAAEPVEPIAEKKSAAAPKPVEVDEIARITICLPLEMKYRLDDYVREQQRAGVKAADGSRKISASDVIRQALIAYLG